jgi:hypothetical protein
VCATTVSDDYIYKFSVISAKMSSRRLRSRSQSVDGSGSVQGNKDEDSSTGFSQEAGIMISESRDAEVRASNSNLENTNQQTLLIIQIVTNNQVAFLRINYRNFLTL